MKKLCVVSGEIRDIPIRSDEIPTCGEEFIPREVFKQLGGLLVSSSKSFQSYTSEYGKVVKYKEVGAFGPLKPTLSDLKVKSVLEKRLSEFDAVNVHTFLPRTNKFLQGKGKPVLMTSHGGFPVFRNYAFWKKPLVYWRKFFEKWAVKYIDIFIAINKYMEAEFEKYGVNKPVRLIYSGVDSKEYTPKRGKWSKKTKIVFLSRLDSQKGVFEFIKLAESQPKMDFVLMGACTKKREDEVRRSLPENVDFLPNVSEEKKKKVLSEGQIFVSLSKGYDPTPNVLYEAMGSEMCVFSTLKHYRYDVLGDDAIWIDSWKDVARHLSDKKQLKSRARRLRKKVVKKFNTERMGKEYKAILDSF